MILQTESEEVIGLFRSIIFCRIGISDNTLNNYNNNGI